MILSRLFMHLLLKIVWYCVPRYNRRSHTFRVVVVEVIFFFRKQFREFYDIPQVSNAMPHDFRVLAPYWTGWLTATDGDLM